MIDVNEFRFKKKYGQNFLIDKNIINKIVDTIPIKANNLVIEIGCGDGKLTTKLCEKFDKVIGYEIDTDLKDTLKNNLKEHKNYELIFEDFLKRNIKEDIKKENKKNIYVVANLPYYITTPIIEKLIEEDIDVEMMRLMVQKEVGERFTAKPGTKEYGSITVYLNYNFEVKKDFIVKRTSFKPAPNVDSIIISLYKKDKKEIKSKENLYKIIRDSFKYKRKTLKNNLKEYDFETIKEILKQKGYKEDVRAEMLDLDTFCEIADSI